MTFGKIILFLAFVSLHASPTYAACRVPPFAFFPERNDNLVVTATVARSAPCVHMLGEGPATASRR